MQLQAVLGSIQDGLFVLDKDWRYTYVNGAAAALLKTTPDQLIGKVVWETFPKSRHSRFRRGFTRAAERKIFVEFEEFYEPLGRWYECRCYPMDDGLTVFFTNTTSCRQTEEALLESRQVLEMAITGSNAGIWRIDLDPEKPGVMPDYIYLSPQLKALIGFADDEFPNSRSAWESRILPEDRMRVQESARAHAERRTDTYQVDFRIRHKDGSIRWLSSRGKLYRDAYDRPIRWASIDSDITDRKQAEEALREREERYRSFFADDLTGDFIATPDGKIIECNPAFADIYGFAGPARAMQCDISRFNPDDWIELIARVKKEHRVRAHECLHRRPDGTEVWVVANVVGRFTEGGELAEVEGYVFDDTERKRVEETLRRSEAILAQAGQMANLGAWEIEITNRDDINANPLRWSEQVYRIFGYEPGSVEVTNDLFFRHVHPGDRQSVADAVAQALAEKRPYEIEHRIIRPDGTERVVLEHADIKFDSEGRPLRMIGAVQDVTERQRAEEALRESEQRFKSTFENAAVGITHVGLDGRFLRYNGRFCEITGYDCDELTGKTFQEITHPDDLKAEMSRRERLQKGEIARYSIEKRYIRKEGAPRWVNLTVSAQRDDEGRIEYFIAIVQDISRRKQVEELLRDNEQRLRLALEGARMGRWEWDAQTDRTFWDERVSELLGVDKRDPATRESFFHRVDQQDRNLLEELLQKALTGQEDFQAEFRVVHQGGEILWLALHGRVLRDEQGRAVRMMGVMYDITQRKHMEDDLRRLNDQLEDEVVARTEELRNAVDRLHDEVPRRVLAEGKLRKRSQMLEAFFQHTITPLAFIDKYFNFVRVNEAYARAEGRRPEYFVGKNYFALYPDPESRAIFERVVRTRQPYQAYAKPFVFPGAAQRGITYWNWWLTPLLNDAGEVQFLVLNLEDVTERQEAFSEVQERARQLQQLTLELSEAEDRERKRLAEILHDDLQQMLAAAKFHLGLLSNRVQGDKELVEMAGQVKEMLKDAIEKSRNLSHELSPPGLAHSDLREAFEWLAQQMQTKHGLTVHLDACEEVDLESEPLKSFLYKAAQEVLFNVIKHAQVREARLRLRRRRGRVYLSVADKGRGFDSQTPDKTGRFGLLTIRERVKLLGGRMKIRSTRGKGSVLLIAVPDSEPKRDQLGEQKTEGTEQKVAGPDVLRPASPDRILRVLLVDDHRIVRQGLESMLAEEPDIEIVGQAGNGREAVDLAYQFHPDVVVMDVAMPVMAGDEATRQIKLHLPQTRVIALSMFDDARVAEKMRRAGAVAYLLKTAPSEDLLAAIRGIHPTATHVS